jgi:anti-sigma factor RsiW
VSFGSSHLGEEAAALADGELGHDERERALAHVAVCAECRAEVEAQRRLKHRLDSLPAVGAPSGLESRLRALAVPLTPPMPPSPPSPGRWTLGPSAPAGFARPDAGGGGFPPSSSPHRANRRRPLLAVAAATAFAASVGAVSLLSAGPQRTIDPGADVFVVEHVTSPTRGPLADPAVGTLRGPGASANSDTPGER